jgi:hypothetical protein
VALSVRNQYRIEVRSVVAGDLNAAAKADPSAPDELPPVEGAHPHKIKTAVSIHKQVQPNRTRTVLLLFLFIANIAFNTVFPFSGLEVQEQTKSLIKFHHREHREHRGEFWKGKFFSL